jgi:hypothetical protein
MDSPSRWGLPCLKFWFLNPSACHVCLHCIVYHVISYSCLAFCLRNRLFYPQYFLLLSWETSADFFFLGWQLKHVRRLLFCLGISKPLSLRTSLILPYMLGLDVISFSISMFLLFFCLLVFKKKKKKKNWGEDVEFFFFSLDSFSDILYVFAWYLNSLCINWICLYMIESLCLISAKFSCCILMINSYFPHAMKMCTIQGSPKVHHFPL